MLALSFIFGSVVGSFLNVVLLRKNTGESVIFDGSRCFSCGKKLGFFELIPILSFVLQKGRCRHCGSKISWQYPIVEAAVGLIAAAVYLKISSSANLLVQISNFQFLISNLYYFLAFSLLFLVAAYDFKQKIIDSHFLYAFGALALVEALRRGALSEDLASSFFIAVLFYILWLVSSGRWMGRGDADLAFFTALFLGWPANLLMLLFAFWIGGATSIFLLAFLPKKFGWKSEVPFGPFLASATFLVWCLGDLFRFFVL